VWGWCNRVLATRRGRLRCTLRIRTAHICSNLHVCSTCTLWLAQALVWMLPDATPGLQSADAIPSRDRPQPLFTATPDEHPLHDVTDVLDRRRSFQRVVLVP
jgi:hypothetical protein